MPTFRHIIATDLLEHGSPLESVRHYQIKGQQWTEVVPKRDFTYFEYDSKVEGARMTPVILFGESPAVFEFEKPKAVRYSGFPSTYEFLLFPFLFPEVFAEKICERIGVFRSVKENISNLKEALVRNNLADTQLARFLLRWREDNTRMLPYMFLTLMSDEITLSAFVSAAFDCYNNHDALSIIAEVFHSGHIEDTSGIPVVLPISRDFVFPPVVKPDAISLPMIEPSIERIALFQRDLASLTMNKKLDSLRKEFVHVHKGLTSLAYQMMEESYQVWQSYAILTNHILDRISSQFIQRKITLHPRDVLDMGVTQIIEFLN